MDFEIWLGGLRDILQEDYDYLDYQEGRFVHFLHAFLSSFLSQTVLVTMPHSDCETKNYEDQ